jgi:phosphomevalonate kinase
MTFLSTAPGKLVLLGEYVVLEGAPALVMAVDRRAEVRCTKRTGGVSRISAPSLGIEQVPWQISSHGDIHWPEGMPESLDRAANVIESAHREVSRLQLALPPCELDLNTDAFFKGPDKLGLGSSAAISVALYGALLAASDCTRAQARSGAGIPGVWDASQRLEAIATVQDAHQKAQGGRGSGVDVAASLAGGVIRYQNDPHGLRIAPVGRLRDVVVVPIWSGKPASTKSFLTSFAAFKVRDSRAYWASCERLAILANAGSEFWALGNTAALLTIVDEYCAALDALGEQCGADIVTKEHRAIAAQVRRTGAAYKPSGAGGGDLGVAICASQAMADKVLARLKSAGLEAVPMGIASAGLQVQTV